MNREPTPLQREYRESLALLKDRRQKEYQQFLESFASDAVKTIRAIRTLAKNNPDCEALIDLIERDWQDLQKLKKSL